MKFIFIRHGKDDDNYRGGWSNRDITQEGIEQSEKLANYLLIKKDNLNVKKIISSDLKRTITTSNIINEKLNLLLEYDSKLREINNGDLSGMENKEALDKYPNLFFNTLDMDEKYPNGESPIEFYNRISEWLYNAINLYKKEDGSIIIVTHGGVINIIYYIVKGLKWTNKEKSFKVNNCSLNILDLNEMKFDVENFINY